MKLPEGFIPRSKESQPVRGKDLRLKVANATLVTTLAVGGVAGALARPSPSLAGEITPPNPITRPVDPNPYSQDDAQTIKEIKAFQEGLKPISDRSLLPKANDVVKSQNQEPEEDVSAQPEPTPEPQVSEDQEPGDQPSAEEPAPQEPPPAVSPEQPPALEPFEFAYPMGNPWNGVTKEEYQEALAFTQEWFPPVIEKLRLLNNPEINERYLILLRDAMATREIIIAPYPAAFRNTGKTAYLNPITLDPYADRNKIRYLLSISMANAKTVPNSAELVSTPIQLFYTLEVYRLCQQEIDRNRDEGGNYDGKAMMTILNDKKQTINNAAKGKGLQYYPLLLRSFIDEPNARSAYQKSEYPVGK